jgi:hypothetical protein
LKIQPFQFSGLFDFQMFVSNAKRKKKKINHFLTLRARKKSFGIPEAAPRKKSFPPSFTALTCQAAKLLTVSNQKSLQ